MLTYYAKCSKIEIITNRERYSYMVKLEKRIVDDLYNSIESGDTEQFLDSLGSGLHLNSTRVENGERVMLFEDGETYTVRYRLGEFDGEKEKAIIEMYAECGGRI